MSEKIPGVVVPARVIPFPASISPEARVSLARLVGDDGVPRNALYTMPLSDDHAGWMKIKAAADAQYAAAVKGLAGMLRSSVETIQTNAATLHIATPETVLKSDCAYLDLHGGALVLEEGRLAASGRGCRPISMAGCATASISKRHRGGQNH